MGMTDEAPTRVRVMVLEDDPDVAKAIARELGAEGHDVELQSEPIPVLARLDNQEDWDVVLLDVGLPGMSGIDVLHRFREANALASIIMLTGDNTAATAATCMRAGAFYYLTKPFRPFELASMVESAARYSTLRRQLRGTERPTAADSLLVGVSAEMRKLRAALDRLASQDVSVLIRGESGTGKELVARTLHQRGARSKKRFVPLNCGDMPVAVQARLLRVLQEGEVRPVGGSTTRTVDVRVIAATHVDLGAAVAQHRFREDLFYRLNVVVLQVPPLRDRRDDLPLLAAHFLKKHASGEPLSLSPDALEVMASYAWPGNVRELENALMHAIALHHGEILGPESLPSHIGARPRGGSPAVPAAVDAAEIDEPLTEAKRRASATFEKRYLLAVMERSKGSVSEAARLSGLDRTNFRRLLQRHGIDAAVFK